MAAFGFAVGDFVALGSLAWNLYRQCRDAPAEFQEVCNEVNSLHTALRELSEEAENEDSILGRADRADRAGRGRKTAELRMIMENCTTVLNQLNNIVRRYRSLGSDRKALLDRLRLDREAIRDIRTKLILHTTTLTQFMTSLNSGSLGRLERGQEQIMDKIDDMASDVRAGIREPSVLLAVEEPPESSRNDSAWERFSRDILGEFSQEQVEQNRTAIQTHIRDLIAHDGLREKAENEIVLDDSGRVLSPRVPPSANIEGANSHPPSPQLHLPARTSSSSPNGESRDPNGRSAPSPPAQYRRSAVGPTQSLRSNVSQPSESIEPVQVYAGISVGPQFSQVALYNASNQSIEVCPDHHGDVNFPSCVAFTPTGVLVGYRAATHGDQSNVFRGFMSMMGEQHDSEVFTAACTNFDVRSKGGRSHIYVPYRSTCVSPEYLLAALIKGLLNSAVATMGRPVNIKSIAVTISDLYILPKRQAIATACSKLELVGKVILCHGPLANAFEWAANDQSVFVPLDDDKRVLSIEICPPFIQYALIETSTQRMFITSMEGHRWPPGAKTVEETNRMFAFLTKFLRNNKWQPSPARVLLLISRSNADHIQGLVLQSIEDATVGSDGLCPEIELDVVGVGYSCRGLALHASRPVCPESLPLSQPQDDEICGFVVKIATHRPPNDNIVQSPMMLRHLNHQSSTQPSRMISPASQMQGGILLRVSAPLRPPPFFLSEMLLFELAVPFPRRLLNTPELIPLKLDLRFSSIDTFQMQVRTCLGSTIIIISYDVCGYLKILEGDAVPISQTIRNNWLIQPVD